MSFNRGGLRPSLPVSGVQQRGGRDTRSRLSATQPSPVQMLGCPECDFKCVSTNQMSLHMYTTRHCLVRCPECECYIVAKAFYEGLLKRVKRAQGQGHGRRGSTHAPTRSVTESEGFRLKLDKCTHGHLVKYPELRLYEKCDFILPGTPAEYGLQAGESSQALPETQVVDWSRAKVAATARTGHPDTYYCMNCMCVSDSWTQAKRHFNLTQHTLPFCAECLLYLKCYGKFQPGNHEAAEGHFGFYGVFYTRNDYKCNPQQPAALYRRETFFTGLSKLQYSCVCGVCFLNIVALAIHLRQYHNVTSIAESASCFICSVTLPLANMLVHMAQERRKLSHHESLRERVPPAPHPSWFEGHYVVMEGFSPLPFLRYRPLPPILRTDHSTAVRQKDAIPPYVILYQCRECLYVYMTWAEMVNHIESTNHCRTYCVECQSYLPIRLAGSRFVEEPAHGAAARDIGKAIAPVNHHHRLNHRHLIGGPPSPEELEKFVDTSQKRYADCIPPTSSSEEGSEKTFMYQCGDDHEACSRVFLYYGDLAQHLMDTGHSVRKHAGALEECAESEDPTMIMFGALFLVSELCEHYGFVRCSYCNRPFPPEHLEVHTFLCVEKFKQASQ